MRLLPLLLLASLLCTCDRADVPPAPAMAPLEDLPLIPLPVEMTSAEGYYYSDGDLAPEELGDAPDNVRELLADGPDVRLDVTVQEGLSLKKGAYLLNVTAEGVTISAGDEAGVLNGAKTLKQVIAFSPNTERGLFLPAGTIVDEPRYAYRGYMLDVARTFFGVDTIKQVIDRIADYKINHLHLHLSDDQGWRIEIKSWPRLTEIGGLTEVDGTYGGFYTQEDYGEIVDYAASRGITVVPEIDVPGHTNAALSAYAELNADGVARQPYTGTDVGFSTLDANKEVTYRFLGDVVREISAITPGPYFHLGGDESSVTPHEDYVKLVRRMQDTIVAYGKTPIGWDEMAVAGMVPGAVAQLWNHTEYALRAQKNGNQVLMSPANKAYLDMQYDSLSRIGLHWAAFIEVDQAYGWDPATLTEGISDSDILGVESPLWGETIRNLEDIDYLTFPRLTAYAELGWTPQRRRNYADYLRRLAPHQTWLKSRGIATYDTKVLK